MRVLSARKMFEAMDQDPPPGKEKHHGNKRKQMARLKVQARRQERRGKKAREYQDGHS